MRFDVLGPLRVERDGEPLGLGSRRQRALLARLLVDAGHTVSTDRLVDDLWGESPPPRVAASLQAYVSNLRRTLQPERRLRDTGGILRSVDPGYAVDLTGHEFDVAQFVERAQRCRELARARDLGAARSAGEAALALWRGPVLADLAEDYPFVGQSALRWEEERAAVTEEVLAIRVAAGDHLSALPDLEEAVRRYPFRERGWEQLVRALYRAGRTAESLDRLREAQRLLREELGVEPGSGLRALEAAVLRRDPALDPPRRRSVAPAPAAPGRTAAAAASASAGIGIDPIVDLVGREGDVAALRDLLARNRLLTVTGAGGVGKTALSLEVARRSRAAFSGGAVQVPLAAVTDPALVLPTLSRALGVEQVTGDPFESLRTAIGDRRVLVLLDNVEHLLPAAVDIARVLQVCPTLTVLATGRSPLRLRGEQEYPVAPLPGPDAERPITVADLHAAPATRLFLERVRALIPGYTVRDTEEAEAVAAICRRLDGLPLAMELAAAWMRVLSPGELLVRLDRALTVLTDGPRDLPERQRTVRNTVAWSYDLLGPAERRLFTRLAVFRGGWTLEAARSVTAGGEEDAGVAARLAAGHATLAERSLVSRVAAGPVVPAASGGGASRFTMLETVREFGMEALDATGPADEVRSRHAGYFRSLATRAERGLVGPDQAGWLACVGDDHANLRAALSWCLEAGHPDPVAETGWGIRWFWHIRGFQAEGRRWMRDALADERLSPGARVRAHLVEGQCAFGQGAWEDATATLTAAYEARDGVEADVVATVAAVAGHAAVGGGDWAAAAWWGDRALEVFARLDDPAGAGIAALLPVQVAAAAGDLATADRLLDRAEGLLRRAGGSWGIAAALNIRVMIGQLAGRGAELLPLLHESVQRSAALRDTAAFLYALTSLAEVLVAVGELRQAARLFGAAEALADRTGLSLQPPASRALYEQFVGRLRADLDGAALEQAWAAGRALTPAETFAAALAASA